MGDWAYLSRNALKDNIADPLSVDDAIYRRVLEAASEQIDEHCQRTFRVVTATRYYTPAFSDALEVEDLLAVTSLKQDKDGDGAYEDTWATTDYRLWPLNAAVNRRPYTELRLRPNGLYTFTVGVEAGIELTGTWGWYEDLEALSSTLTAALSSTATSCTITDGTEVEALQTLRIDSEDIYITGISGATLMLVRGVNGTAAAAHDSGASLRRHRYPARVVEACAIQALRLFNRKDSPEGVKGTADLGFIRVRPEMDPDAKKLLEGFRKLPLGAV